MISSPSSLYTWKKANIDTWCLTEGFSVPPTAPKRAKRSCAWTCPTPSPRGWQKLSACPKTRAWAWLRERSFVPSSPSLWTSRCLTAWSEGSKPKFPWLSTTIWQRVLRYDDDDWHPDGQGCMQVFFAESIKGHLSAFQNDFLWI